MKKTLAIFSIGAVVAGLSGVASAQTPVYQTVTYATVNPAVIQYAQYAQPVIVQSQPVIVQTQPVYVQAPPVVVYQQPVYVAPPPVYVAPRPVYYPPPFIHAGVGIGHRSGVQVGIAGPLFGFGFSFGGGHGHYH